MIRFTRIGAAAGIALLGSTALASAQQQAPEKGRGGSEREMLREQPRIQQRTQQPSSRERPNAADGPARDRPMGAERQDKDRPKSADRPDRDRPMGAERQDDNRPKSADRPDRDRPMGAERQDDNRPKSADRPDRDRPMGAERQNKDRPKSADRPDRDRPMGAERQDGSRPNTARPDLEKNAPNRTRLSEQQRGEIGVKLRQTPIERSRTVANIKVGLRVPASVRLRPLPGAIVALAPAYRGHSYFVSEDDTIVIVDARTNLVVDVIPATARTAGLSLSSEQMRFIYAMVPKDRTEDIRLRLALGAEVPPDVELLPLPPDVLARVPDVEGYRYVVASNGDVAIVNPRSNEIALVISE